MDHDPTPINGVPHPGDGQHTTDPTFDFDRLGIRVPTIAISPWVPKVFLVSSFSFVYRFSISMRSGCIFLLVWHAFMASNVSGQGG